MSGKKQRRTFVGVIGLALVLFVLSFSVASCGGTKGGSKKGGDGDSPPTQPKDGD